HGANLACFEPQLDARADQGVGVRALAPDVRLSHQHAEPGDLIELHRVAARGDVAPVDRRLAPAPHAVVALEAHPVRDHDVRLGRVGGGARAVVDRGAAGGVHLHGIADALHDAVVGEVRPAQYRSGYAVHRHHVAVRLEPLLVQAVGGVGGVQGERAIPDTHQVPLPDHVEATDPGDPGHAVARDGAARLAAMGQHTAARENVGLSL